jgi:hypothetical protein
MATYPNTGTEIDRGIGSETEGRTSTGLSTQIIVKVEGVAVGALQELTVTQARGVFRVPEIGFDGHIEIVPNAPTTFDLSVSRIVFDSLRLPEAFSRAFRFISAQRIPFDIQVYDVANISSDAEPNDDSGVIGMTFTNCWFTNYTTPYRAGDYIITETATIAAEQAEVSVGTTPNGLRDITAQTDAAGIERLVNIGDRRGSLDGTGLLQAVFSSSES